MDSSYDNLIHEFMKNDKFHNSLITQLADFGDRLVQEINSIPEGNISEASWQHNDLWPASLSLENDHSSLSDFIEVLSDSVVWIDRTGTIRGLNQSTEFLFGRSRSELTGKSIIDFVHTDDRTQLFEHWSSSLRNPHQSFQLKIYHQNGTLVHTETNAIPLIKRDNFLGTLLVMKNLPGTKDTAIVTSRANDAELDQLAPEIPYEKIRRILHQIKEIFYIASADGSITFISPEVENVLGYAPAEVLAMKIEDKYQDPQDRTHFKRLLQLHGWVKDFRYTFRNKRGETCHLSETASVLTNNQNQVTGYYGIVRDRTAEHQIEQALKNSEENYRILIEQLPQALILLDVNGRILQTNRQGLQCLNSISSQAIKGCSVFELCQPQNTKLIREAIQTAASGQSVTNEWQRKDSKGNLHWWKMTFTPVRCEDAVEKIIWLARDIDREKRMEDQLQLNQKMETVATLIGGLTHDLNNQLGVILGNASFIKDQLTPGNTFYEEINAIESTALSIRAMLDQLTAFTTKKHYHHTTFSLNQMIQSLVDFITRTFPKNINISVELKAESDVTAGDRDDIYQALLNICVNSKDAMPLGGNLTIITANASRESIIHEHDCNHFLQISITDTGEGMDAETCRRIFEPFFTTKRESGGTGLGMSTTYSIIQHHDGFIEIDSKKDLGTKIDVFLPVAKPDEDIEIPYDSELSTTPITPDKDTILIVDDEPQVRAMMQRIFEKEGFTVHMAENGVKALDILQQHPSEIHLIILDMTMPEMDGKDTLSNIRKLYPEIPVLLSSGYSLNQEIQDLTKQPHTYFIHKPYRRATILQTVQQILTKTIPLSTS
jgi:PAS domain S-box-containing protein